MRLPLRWRPASRAAADYARAPLPRARSRWREASFCVVDLELTGLDPDRHEIISFGALAIEQGRVALAQSVYGLVRPSGPLPSESVLVHGLRSADLECAPPMAQAIDTLLEVMTGRVLVVHAAAVERAFLTPALRRRGVHLRGPLIDTRVLGRLWLLRRDGHAPRRLALADLVRRLGLPSHRPHHALGDALTTGQAFLALATHLDAEHPETVRSLAHAGDRVQALLRFPRSGPGDV